MISVIIPIYNEEESLSLLLERIKNVLDAYAEEYEILCINDGSKDKSLAVLKEQIKLHPSLIVVDFRRNFGKAHALTVGFNMAKGHTIITMDADLQDDPDEIPNLLAKLDEGYEVVTGWKRNRQDPISKRFPSFIANTVTQLVTGVKVKDMNSGFKAYRSKVVREIDIYGDLHRYIPILAQYAGFSITQIPVKHHKRQFGKSKYGISRLWKGFIDFMSVVFLGVIRYRPLHLFGSVGSLLTGAGVLAGAYLTVLWFLGYRPIGDRPLPTLSVLLTILGIQLISIGLLAELIVSINHKDSDKLTGIREIYHAKPTDSVDETDVPQRIRFTLRRICFIEYFHYFLPNLLLEAS